MLNTYFKTAFSSSRGDLVITNDSIDAPMPYRPLGVWDFGGDSDSLNSNYGDSALTPTGDITYTDNTVKLSALPANYLSSTIPDGQNMTAVVIMKIENAAFRILMGTGTASGASNYYMSTSNGLSLSVSSGFASKVITPTLVSNSYFAVALSINFNTRKVFAHYKKDGVGVDFDDVMVTGHAGTGSNFHLGNLNLNITRNDFAEYAALALYDKSLSLVEIKLATDKMIINCAERGVII